MTQYINIPVVADTDTLIQQALASIATNVPGWIPREGNLEVLLIEQFAAMAAQAATVASDVPSTIFTYFGSLIGITPNEGTEATIQVTWMLINNAPSGGYQIPAGTIAGFFYNGATLQFQTITDYTIPAGAKTLTMVMQAVASGSIYNISDLSNFNPIGTYLQLQISDPNTSSIVVTNTAATLSTAGLVMGSDAESTDSFLGRLTAELQLLAPRPITPSDYAVFAQNIALVYRALAFDGFNPLTNRLATADANFLTAATSSSAPSGWTAIGNGTATLPTLSTPGTSPANYLQITSTGTALVNPATFNAATVAGATSLVAKVGTGPTFSTTISSSAPAFIAINDTANGNCIAMVTAASAASGSGSAIVQTLTIASPGLLYAHGITATIKQLQGVSMPNVTGLAANTDWYQASTVMGIGNATANTDSPYVVSVATYVDGSVRLFSSLPQYDSSLYLQSVNTKTVTCNITSANANSLNALAYDPSVTSTFQNLKPYIISVQNYVLTDTTQISKTNRVYYNSLNQTNIDIASAQNPNTTTSSYNFIPDSNFVDYLYANGSSASWTNPTGTTILPNYGIQYIGTGSVSAIALTSNSQIFNLSYKESDNTSATSRTYTLFATIDSSYAGTTYGKVSVKIVDASPTATVLATLTAPAATINTLVATFTLTAPKDVMVQIVFDTGLNVPLNQSVIVSNIGVVSGTYTVLNVPSNSDMNYSWTPGGLYSPNTFNYARTVTVAPILSTGLPVGASVSQYLSSYLASRREVNFTVNTINPSYVPIDVSWTGYVAAGYTVATVQTAVNTAIRNFLNPANWAGGANTPPYWDGSQTTVRVYDVAGIIAGTTGVASVTSVGIKFSYPTGGTYGTTDIALNGIAPLPIANTVIGALSSNSTNAYSGFA